MALLVLLLKPSPGRARPSSSGPLPQMNCRLWGAVGPFWLRVEGSDLFLAFPGGGPPASPFFSPEGALARWVERLRREVGALEGLVRALG